MKISSRAQKKWIERALARCSPDTLSPLVRAQDARTLARVSRLLGKGYALVGSAYKSVSEQERASEIYRHAGELYVKVGHLRDASRMYRAAGLEEKAHELEEKAARSSAHLRRTILGSSFLFFLGFFGMVSALLLFPSPLGQVIAPVSSSAHSVAILVFLISFLLFLWLMRRTVLLWLRFFTAIFK